MSRQAEGSDGVLGQQYRRPWELHHRILEIIRQGFLGSAIELGSPLPSSDSMESAMCYHTNETHKTRSHHGLHWQVG